MPLDIQSSDRSPSPAAALALDYALLSSVLLAGSITLFIAHAFTIQFDWLVVLVVLDAILVLVVTPRAIARWLDYDVESLLKSPSNRIRS